ncbi:MAG: DEAD/DEAH box helicase family protein, partial [Thermococcus sp.]|nr:DEAD/DEAH box helicase family protein [Thermococcus sp.]
MGEVIDYVRFRVGVDSNFIFTRYLYDPVTVLATSKIDLLPYQIEDFLTLLDMAETGEVRVLLAYETGLGKTIVTGLFLKEMLLRDENQRVLILVPPNVRRQWKRELREKFNL